MDEWDKDKEKQKRESNSKREKAVLITWKKVLVGLRIIKKVQNAYNKNSNRYLREKMNLFTNKKEI